MIELLLAGALMVNEGCTAEYPPNECQWLNSSPTRQELGMQWPPGCDPNTQICGARSFANKLFSKDKFCRDQLEAAMRAMEDWIPSIVYWPEDLKEQKNPIYLPSGSEGVFAQSSLKAYTPIWKQWQAAKQECWRGP